MHRKSSNLVTLQSAFGHTFPADATEEIEIMANLIEERGRITARVPLAVQEKLQEAADLVGATVNQFVVQSALEKAEQIIDREKMISLTRHDAAMLINLLENPPKLNAALKRALERYKGRINNGELRSNAGPDA